MKLEDQIKETLMKHAEDVRPDAGSWNGVETKVRRSHYARAAMVSTVAIAVIAVGAIAIPRLGTTSKNNKNGLIGASPSTSTRPSPEPISGVRHVGANLGFSIVLPETWRSGLYEAVYEYGPPGLPSLAKGGDTFAITVSMLHGKYDSFQSQTQAQNPPLKGNGNDFIGTGSDFTINGMNAAWMEMRNTPTHQAWYFIEWGSCPLPEPEGCSTTEPNTLQVHISANTEALWSKYSALADRIAYSIKRYDGSSPAYGDAPVSQSDGNEQALVLFLDSRVEGFDAELFMTPQAEADFNDTSNCLDLYEARTNHKRWSTYEVLSRVSQGSNTSFTAMMKYDANSGGYIETLVVGTDTDGIVKVLSGEPSCGGGVNGV